MSPAVYYYFFVFFQFILCMTCIVEGNFLYHIKIQIADQHEELCFFYFILIAIVILVEEEKLKGKKHIDDQ